MTGAKARDPGPDAADSALPASALLRTLLRRLAPALQLAPADLDQAAADPTPAQRDRVEALRAVARTARRARAAALDATLTREALLVAVDAPPATDATSEFSRAETLVGRAFSVPLVVRRARWIGIPPADPAAPAVNAAASLARAYFDRMRAMETEAMIDEDPEGAHQLRVAVRRGRVALRLLAREAPSGDVDAADASARELGALAGAVRDCDVARDVLRNEIHDRAVLAAAEAAIAARRAPAVVALRAGLRARELRARVTAARRTLDALSLADAEGAALAHAAPAAFQREVRRLRRRLGADFTAPGAYHDVRRQLRRVRDAAEVFSTALRKNQREERARLQPLQALLGRLNDLEVVESLLGHGHDRAIETARSELRRARLDTVAQCAVPLALLAVRLVRGED